MSRFCRRGGVAPRVALDRVRRRSAFFARKRAGPVRPSVWEAAKELPSNGYRMVCWRRYGSAPDPRLLPQATRRRRHRAVRARDRPTLLPTLLAAAGREPFDHAGRHRSRWFVDITSASFQAAGVPAGLGGTFMSAGIRDRVPAVGGALGPFSEVWLRSVARKMAPTLRTCSELRPRQCPKATHAGHVKVRGKAD